MMSKAAHSRNAFSYSCFGATPVIATAEERSVDRWGFSIVGNDGKTTSPGYYESTITIPPVIPDGKFVLGWVWYGGTGGETSDVPYTEEPWWKGYFSDYWSCSFVEISGGVPLEREYRPVFENDMKQFSSMGCMSANNAPGICVREPCVVEGKYQKPLPFASGAGPGMLTPEHFGGKTSDAPAGSVAPSPSPSPTPEVEDEMAMYYYEGVGGMMKLDEEEVGRSQRACMCMVRGTKCDGPSATMTGRTCRHRTEAGKQPEKCLKRCCDYCSMRFEGKLESDRAKICGENVIRGICNR